MPLSREKKTADFLAILTQPWFYFFIFTITSSVLAYIPFGLEIKIWVGLIGWGIPFGLGLLTFSRFKPQKYPLFSQETLPSIPGWLWLAVAMLALTVRLYILLNSHWFVPDEGLLAFISLELSKKWEWHFFFTTSQIPPLFFWVSALLFKVVNPSIFSIRLFSFLLSVFSPILSYFTARLFFSKSMSFLCLLFCSLTFWPLYSSRFCMYMQPLFILQIIAFLFLGLISNARLFQNPILKGLGLGLSTGVGFWLAIAWPLAALMIILALVFKLKYKILKASSFSIALWLPILLFLIPFIIFSIQQKNGEHIKFLLSFSTMDNVTKRISDGLSNWTALFWGCDRQNSYGPLWGGMLNPFASSLFFIGILELFRYRRLFFTRWILTAFFVFMIPGFITNTFNIFRSSLVLPLLWVICSCGAESLLAGLQFSKRIAWLASIFLVASTLDTVHLIKTYLPEEETNFSLAFDVLRQKERDKGPGLILLDLQPNTGNQTLAVAVYSFNAAQNLGLDPSKARWAAVIENSNYKSFLTKRFPGGQGLEIGPDSFWNEGGLILWVIPLDDSNRPDFLHWLELDQQLHNITRETYFDNSRKHQPEIFNHLLSLESHIQGDPFLESVFFEHVFYYRRAKAQVPELLTWVQKALEKGYPLPHLLVREGVYFQKLGRPQEARASFNVALQAPFNSPSAKENLRILDLLEKNDREKPQGNNLTPPSHESSR